MSIIMYKKYHIIIMLDEQIDHLNNEKILNKF